jgi:hypothetical protein
LTSRPQAHRPGLWPNSPSAPDRSHAARKVDFSVIRGPRVPKNASTCPCNAMTSSLRAVISAIRDRTVAEMCGGEPAGRGRYLGAGQLRGAGRVPLPADPVCPGQEVLAALVPQPLPLPGAVRDQRLARRRPRARVQLGLSLRYRAQLAGAGRTMSASMRASPIAHVSDQPCRSRYRDAWVTG